MNIDVIGPNLPPNMEAKGSFHVHRADCPDGRQLAWAGYNVWHLVGIDRQRDVVANVYGDIAEDNNEPIEQYFDDVYFAPCTEGLFVGSEVHPNILELLTLTEWTGEDEDIEDAIELLRAVLVNRARTAVVI